MNAPALVPSDPDPDCERRLALLARGNGLGEGDLLLLEPGEKPTGEDVDARDSRRGVELATASDRPRTMDTV